MFCTFILVVLLVKWCFPTVDQLWRYLAIDILQSRSWLFGVMWHSNGNKGQVVELHWPHSIARPPKPPIRCKDFGDISYRIQIIALLSHISLPWQQGLVWVKFCWQYLMAQPSKPPYRHKDLADRPFSSRSWVIANFVPNFVAIATRDSSV